MGDSCSSDEDSTSTMSVTGRDSADRECRHHRSHCPAFDLKKIRPTNNFERPLPVKEDIVIFMMKGHCKLGHVAKSVSRYARHTNMEGTIGTYFVVDQIPIMRPVTVLAEEAMVSDRAFSIGETVMRFNNKHAGSTLAKHRWNEPSMIGQIVGARTTADILLLPEKKHILKNVPMKKFKTVEMMSFHSSHNYVLMDDWIGDITDTENEITLVYKKQRFTVIESTANNARVYRKDRNDDNKSFVPGELVHISLNDALARSVKWEGDPPSSLKRRYARHFTNERILCMIEKVVPRCVHVRWVTSPSSSTQPDIVVHKEDLHKLTFIDVSANPRVSPADRIVVNLETEMPGYTKKQYFDDLKEEYARYFDKAQNSPSTADEEPETGCKLTHSSSQLDTVIEEGEFPIDDNMLMTDVAEMEIRSKDDENDVTMNVNSGHIKNPADSNLDMEMSFDEEDEEDGVDVDATTMGMSSVEQSVPTVAEVVETLKNISHLPTVHPASAQFATLKRGRKGAARRVPRKKKCPTPSTVATAATRATDKYKGIVVGEVLTSHTYVDVEWMNGDISKDVPGYSLLPVDPDLDQQDHLPGNIVAKKSKENHDNYLGVILKTDPEDRVATVRWIEFGDNISVHPVMCNRTDRVEECTLFDIMMHPYYQRQYQGQLGARLNDAVGNSDGKDMKKVFFKVLQNLPNGTQLCEFMDGTREEIWPMEFVPIDLREDEYQEDDEDEENEHPMANFAAHEETENGDVAMNEVSSRRYEEDTYDDAVVRVAAIARAVTESTEEDERKLLSGFGMSKKTLTFYARDDREFKLHFDNMGKAPTANRSSSSSTDVSNVFFDDFVEISRFKMGFKSEDLTWTDLTTSGQLAHIYEGMARVERNQLWLRITNHPDCTLYMNKHFRLSEEQTETDIIESMAPFAAAVDRALVAGAIPFPVDEESVLWTVDDAKHAAVKSNRDRTVRLLQNVLETCRKDDWLPALLAAPPRFKPKFCGVDQDTTTLPAPNWNDVFFGSKKFSVMGPTEESCRVDETDKVECMLAVLQCYWPSILSLTGKDLTCNLLPDEDKELLRTVKTEPTDLGDDDDGLTEEGPSETRELTPVPWCRPPRVTVPPKSCLLSPITNLSDQPCEKGFLKVLSNDFYATHKFAANTITYERSFMKAVMKEHKHLKDHLPDNIHVWAYEARLDLLTVVIVGPRGTPFELTPFHFDLQLPSNYPAAPPKVHYNAWSQEQLNPNLYQAGKVCVSLLGTWEGEKEESWTKESNLLQVFLSIQGLILNAEPYFNEAGYESRKDSPEHEANSRRYNETATINSLEYMAKIFKGSRAPIRVAVRNIIKMRFPEFHERVLSWIDGTSKPSFPVHASKGFLLALKASIDQVHKIVTEPPSPLIVVTRRAPTMSTSSEP